MSKPDAKEFANQVFPYWEDAMDRFFSKVDDKRRTFGMTVKEAEAALVRGYGAEVADDWLDWSEEE